LKSTMDKVQNLEEEVNTLKKEVHRLTEIEEYAHRLKSDFEHFKQVTKRENQRVYASANESLLNKMIPVITNFERALKYMDIENPPKEVEMIIKGVQMIYQSFINTLESEGLRKIDATPGEKYDPFEQEIADKVPSADKEEHTILEVVENGYKFNEKVLKPVRVKVTILPGEDDSSKKTGEE